MQGYRGPDWTLAKEVRLAEVPEVPHENTVSLRSWACERDPKGSYIAGFQAQPGQIRKLMREDPEPHGSR